MTTLYNHNQNKLLALAVGTLIVGLAASASSCSIGIFTARCYRPVAVLADAAAANEAGQSLNGAGQIRHLAENT